MQQNLLTRGFLAACEYAAKHDGTRAGHQRLGDIARIVDATVGDARHARGLACLSCFIDGGQLRNADTGDHAGRADGAWADTDLDRVCASVDHGLSAFAGCDVAADDLHAVERLVGLETTDHIKRQTGFTVGGVHDEHVDTGFHQRGGTLPGVAEEADAGSHTQTALVVLRGIRILLGLHEVLDGDQTGQMALVVHERQLLDLVLGEQMMRVFLGNVGRTGDQVILGHHVLDFETVIILGGNEPHITVGDDADELVVLVHNRQAGNVELAAQLVKISERDFRVHGQRVGDHAGFAALDDIDLSGLVVNGQVTVKHADATVTRHGDGHIGFGDSIHGRGNRRGLHGDLTSEMGGGIDFGRNHIRRVRKQEHIVIREAELGEDRRDRSICLRLRIKI